jgi:cold shock CspA family protein
VSPASGSGSEAESAGRVASFDPEVGLGRVVDDGGRTYPFHCVAIADGSRHIEPGARVRFRVAAGLPGRWEAADIRPDGPTVPAH